jgi:hypothetical protein
VSPGESIQAAIDGASAGDTISIAAGTYTESVILPEHNSLTFVGAGRDTTTWNASGGPCIKWHDGKPVGQIEISGFTFSSGGYPSVMIIEAYRHGATPFGLNIHDNTFYTTSDSEYALTLGKNSGNVRDVLTGESPVRIHDNIFQAVNGIITSNSDNFDIFNNDFTYEVAEKGNAIAHLNGCSSFCDSRGGHHIWDNDFAHYDDCPAVVFWSFDKADATYLPNTIEKNTFTDNDAAAIAYRCDLDLEGASKDYPDELVRLIRGLR